MRLCSNPHPTLLWDGAFLRRCLSKECPSARGPDLFRHARLMGLELPNNASPSGVGGAKYGCRLCRRAFPFWRSKMRVRTIYFVFATSVFGALNAPISALANPELEACRSTGLIALRERDSSIKDVILDFDGMTVAKANTKVEDTPIKTIVIGDAYLEKGKKDTRRTFLCLIGEKGKVLLTFFTDQ